MPLLLRPQLKLEIRGRIHPLLSSFLLLIAIISTNSMSTNVPKMNLRIELFFKGKQELRERVQFLKNYGVTSFNLVNKGRQDSIEEWVDVIQEEMKNEKYSSVCAHYSLKFNKSPSRRQRDDASFQLFSSFLEADALQQKFTEKSRQLTETLLISGSGEKAKLDTISTLQRLKAGELYSSGVDTLPQIAVAYNPFFPLKKDDETERQRLIQKLETDQVDKVYLQFGSSLEKLQSSLKWLSELREKYDFTISGSIFLPTKKLIAQQKFRPWNGVFLSQEFLGSPENAHQIVVQMMKLYKHYNCEILIEAPGVRNDKDMAVVEKLLSDRDDCSDGGNNIKSNNLNPGVANKNSHKNTKHNDNPDSKRRRVVQGSVSSINEMLSLTQSSVSNENLDKPAILLFGSHDVRVHDNEAFQLSSRHRQVIPIFLWNKKDQGKWGVRGAVQVVLKDALISLKIKLQNHNLDLICRNTDDMTKEMLDLCLMTGASTVYFNKEHTTESRIREDQISKVLMTNNIVPVPCQSSLLFDPVSLSLAGGFNGGHWGTLMPFLKACKKQIGQPRRPIAKHETFALLESMEGPSEWPPGVAVEELDLAVIRGKDKWDLPILKRFPMSEENAAKQLEQFMRNGFYYYEKDRSRADIDSSTSKLSPHLRIGTLSPNELYYATEDSKLSYDQKKTFSRRLFWRDLAYYQLLNFPRMRDFSIREHYESTEWCTGDEERIRFKAWKTGQTGYPLVDSGMRELYETGWLTQSMRMVVASFLTEYLRVNWVLGCEHFHYTLVDSDSAINAMMWQNAGRSGIDQWNFVLSPVAASQDATGEYTKKWVPELAGLSKPLLHKPWEAPEPVLRNAGIVLGETYPQRIITDLKAERSKSVENVLAMRRNFQEKNNNRGYDLIQLPESNRETVVFTKKEYRIDTSGNLIDPSKTGKSQIRRVNRIVGNSGVKGKKGN